MAFVNKEILESERHRFTGRRFMNFSGESLSWLWKISIDEERNMYLLYLGGGGGVNRDPATFLFYLNGLFFRFQAGFTTVDKSIDKSGLLFVCPYLVLPMNLAQQTSHILDLLREVFPIYLGLPNTPEAGNIVFNHVDYVDAQWALSQKQDIVLHCFGPDGRYGSYHERDMACYYFSQGRRKPDRLYNFRLWYEGQHIDFRACYRLAGPSVGRWEIIEAAIPAEFKTNTDMLLTYLPLGLRKFSALADPLPMLAPDLSTMGLIEGPGELRKFGSFGDKFFPLKYSSTVPVNERRSIFQPPEDEDHIEREIA